MGIMVFVCTACGANQSLELFGYGPMVVVNGKEYFQYTPEQKNYKLDQEVGEIKEKTDPMYHPINELSSNSLETGTKIY